MIVRKLCLGVGVSVLAVLCGLLTLEAFVRATAPRVMLLPWQDDIHGITVPKPEITGRLASPGQFDTTVSIHDRLRGRHAASPAPAPDTMRIAILGDSTTFGWGAADDDTYPAVLERLLNTQTPDAGNVGKVEVLNAGVIGTGTGEQSLWYDLWVSRFKPSLVVLTVYWNDVDDDVAGAFFETRDGTVRPRPYDILEHALDPVRRTRAIANLLPRYDWLSQHSQLLGWARQAPTEIFGALHARAVGAADTDVSRTRALRDEDLVLFAGEVQWLQRRVAPARLAIVLLPSAELYDATRPDAPMVARKASQISKVLLTLTTDRDIPFLDVGPVLERRSDPRRFFFSRDTHPNPAGYHAYAEAVASFLGMRHLLTSQ